jgi:hypothetical protein
MVTLELLNVLYCNLDRDVARACDDDMGKFLI